MPTPTTIPTPIFVSPIHVIVLCALLCASTNLAAQEKTALKLGNPVRYEVSMVTTLVIPGGSHRIDQIRVYHALPTPRPWSEGQVASGFKALQFHPLQAEHKKHDSTQAEYLQWTVDAKFKPGQKLSYASTFQLTSRSRHFDPSGANVGWSEFKDLPPDVASQVDTKFVPEPTLSKLANELKSGRNPPEAMAAICEWVNKTIRYDASVTYGQDSITDILREKRGHCGHMASTVEHLAKCLGIPIRSVVGLNLTTPNGWTNSLYEIRGDFTNVHTWVEVWFPKIGWVELEPSLGENGFQIPAAYIQNNGWFQNYAVWYRDRGQHRLHSWTNQNGKYSSEWQMENRITFSTAQ